MQDVEKETNRFYIWEGRDLYTEQKLNLLEIS